MEEEIMGPIDYRAVLADLESRKDDLEAAIRSIRKILGEETTPQPASYLKIPEADVVKIGHVSPPSQNAQAIAYFQSHPDQVISIPMMGKALGLKGPSVRRILWRLRETKQIRNVGRGLYQLVASPETQERKTRVFGAGELTRLAGEEGK